MVANEDLLHLVCATGEAQGLAIIYPMILPLTLFTLGWHALDGGVFLLMFSPLFYSVQLFSRS